MRALICAEGALDRELAATVLYRSNLERHHVTSVDEAHSAIRTLKPQVLLIDRDVPGASVLVRQVRENPETRKVSVVVLARGDIVSTEFALLEAGANAVLRLPPTGDWDERLFRLMHVPVRRQVRVTVRLQMDVGLGASGEAFDAVALDLSVNGMLIDTGRPLSVGDDLHFAFDLPEQPGRIEGTSTVVRQAGGACRFGVELANVQADGRVRIKRWVDRL
jgi:CheY-like chemotaxis protein